MTMIRMLFLGLPLLYSVSWADPSAGPIRAMPKSYVAATAYFDHSGQDLFDDPGKSASVLNNAGVELAYSFFKGFHLAVFGGVSEFDIEVPENKQSDTSVFAYNTGYQANGGVSGALHSPRMLKNTTSLFLIGSAGYFQTEDDASNKKEFWVYTGSVGLRFQPIRYTALIVGAQFFALDGEQTSSVTPQPFGNRDYYRGLLGLEIYLPNQTKGSKGVPYIGIYGMPSGDYGLHDDLGLRNAAVSVKLGFATDLTSMGAKPKRSSSDEEDDE